MGSFTLILSCVSLFIGLIAFICSCVAISFIVGLKNSTHKIEWKTFSPEKDSEPVQDEPEEELMGEPMMDENPNKRIKRNVPFTPFPTEPTEPEPFFDEEDPNNISHDFE